MPDSCILLDYMLVTLTKLVAKMLVYPENMRRNMELTGGLYASQAALLMLTEKGMERKDAYEAVQRAAMKTWKEGGGLAKHLTDEPTVSKHLGADDIANACAPERHFRHVERKFQAVGITD
jgi:adenylosuccinate lyase